MIFFLSSLVIQMTRHLTVPQRWGTELHTHTHAYASNSTVWQEILLKPSLLDMLYKVYVT